MNDAGNGSSNAVDPNEKARKNKKKMPLKHGVRVKPPKHRPQTDEIPISQIAPTAEEHGNASQNSGINQPMESSYAPTLQSRMKQPITRPQNPSGVSNETLAATSSGTAARLFKFMPTPGFKPPRQI
ncbi:hypothetical protein PIB30_027763 [Stylosanthes scabra]|uniref:Uncharacterized protein n=1 Tax=Stylosanthes scabra TaxID=79078 RepID=A0ABU6Y914_9FABA|nr:hypothetical protein [Stylosanthes scabra]